VFSIYNPDKKEQAFSLLIRVSSSFRKTLVVQNYVKPSHDEYGIQNVDAEDTSG
jgi:hypothetical protein